MSKKKAVQLPTCILCKREYEPTRFDIPLCVECLCRIHCQTTCKGFDKCETAIALVKAYNSLAHIQKEQEEKPNDTGK